MTCKLQFYTMDENYYICYMNDNMLEENKILNKTRKNVKIFKQLVKDAPAMLKYVNKIENCLR